jgi:plasmid maintenance system antidote protein VapI
VIKPLRDKGLQTYDPPHPGEVIQEVFLTHLDMSRRRVVLRGRCGVSPADAGNRPSSI